MIDEREHPGDYQPGADAWYSHMMALSGVRHISAQFGDQKVAARVFYVATRRPTQRLVGTMDDTSWFAISLLTISLKTYYQ